MAVNGLSYEPDGRRVSLSAKDIDARLRDYRTELRDLCLDRKVKTGETTYKIAQQLSMAGGTLSNVFKLRRHLSITLLLRLLDLLGYELAFVKKQRFADNKRAVGEPAVRQRRPKGTIGAAQEGEAQ